MHNKIIASLLVAGMMSCPLVAVGDDFNPSEVIVESLPALTLNSIGIIPTTNPDLWSQTPANVLIDTIRQIGETNLSPAERQLVAHLLLLDITGTQFTDTDNILGETAFLKERLQTLFNMGEWESVLKLIELIPDPDLPDDILKIKINTLLLKGDVKDSCGLIDERESKLDSQYVDKMRIACFLAKEEKEKAVLAYDIYQEKTGDTDSLFATLAENGLREIQTSLPKNAILSPEDVYVAALNKEMAIDWTKQSRAVKITLADLPSTPIPLRIELGEQSGLPLDAMKKLYRLPLFESDLAGQYNQSVKRALLYQKIMAATDDKQKAVFIREWIDLIKKDKLFVNLAPVIADVFNSMKASPDQIELAYNAVQAYGLENNLSMAEPWFEILKENDLPMYRRQRFLLTPLWQNLGGGYPADLDGLMQRYCGTNPIQSCSMIRLFIDPAFYGDSETMKMVPDITDNQTESSGSEQNKTTRLGESLLKAVLNINSGKELKKSYLFIREVGQKGARDALLREGMIFE